MTDIVEQGRLFIRAEAPDYYEKTVVWKMADEIERLRASLRAIRDYEGHNPVIYDADDAIAMKEIARAALREKN